LFINKNNNYKYMKKTLITLIAAFALFASTAFAEISTYGYLDFFYENGGGKSDTGVYEFEYGMELTEEGSPWSAVIEVSYSDAAETTVELADNIDDILDGSTPFTGIDDLGTISSSGDLAFETFTLTYAASDELSYTIGNILSYQGFEAYDQTGMYQYSYQADGPVYSAGYAVGASVDYVTDDYSLGVWVGDTDTDESFEYLFAFTGIEGVTAKYIYADDPSYETDNFWISYETGDYLFAYETTDTTGAGAVDMEMYLAYIAMGDAGLTLRYSDGVYGGVDYDKFTVSPSYAFSDAVFGLIEYSEVTSDDVDSSFTAVEVLYTF
jgi:hypothetical protein